jgi:resuscitation-promoting factor RpfB
MKFKTHTIRSESSVARHSKTLAQHGRHHIKRRPYLLPIAGFLLGLAVVGATVFAHGGRPVHVSDTHIVFLFDSGGKQQTVDTKAKTVGDLVNKLPLHLIPQDVVEPSLDTPIVEDNFRVNVYRARPVTVTDDKGNKTVTVTAQKSARVVAQDAGLTIYPEDEAVFTQGTLKENVIGEKVVVERAVPVFLNLYGTPLTIRTHSKTVGELLKDKKVKISGGDQVQPASNTPLTPNIQVFVSRSGVQIQTVEEVVPAPTQIVPDGTLSLGASATRQQGSDGKRAVTYQIDTKNGAVAAKTVIQTVIIQDPVPTIVARGTRVLVTGDKTSWMAAAGISAGDYGYVNFVVSHESGWNPASLNGSGCAGLGQACPGSKLAAVCSAWQTDPVCQLRYFTGYANKYGGWGGAYNFWVSHHYW